MNRFLNGYVLLISAFTLIDVATSACDRPRIPENGRIIEFENNNDQTFPTGFEVNVECEDGYRSTIHGTKCDGEDWESKLDDCTLITCSDPGIPENGVRHGNSFIIGDVISYSCTSGFHIIGSPERICQSNGRWSGSITVCDDGASDCADPGIPINSIRVGNNFNAGDIVVYSCKEGYTLFGKNATRECQDDGHWTGQPVECYGPNEFTDQRKASTSILKTLTLIARKKLLSAGPVDFNVLFLVDVSQRITNQQYNHSKELIKAFVKQVEIYPATTGVRVGVISYNSRAVVDIFPNETDTNAILDTIDNMQRIPDNGSNLANAVKTLEQNVLAKSDGEDSISKSIVFLISDGHVTGREDPVDVIESITVEYKVIFFALAVGSNQNKRLLQKITPNVLMFSNYNELIKLIQKSIERKKDDFDCGTVQEEDDFEPNTNEAGQPEEKSKHSLSSIVGGQQATKSWPWIVAFLFRPIPSKHTLSDDPNDDNTTKVFCGGSIIHKDWIVSAAHCFLCSWAGQKEYQIPENWRVVIGKIDVIEDSGLELGLKEIHCHPDFSFDTLNSDIALVKVASSIPFDHFIRPICLPPSYNDLPTTTSLYKAQNPATVIGWGKTIGYSVTNMSTYVDEPAVTHLNEVEIPIQSEEICLTPLNVTRSEDSEPRFYTPTENMVCAGGDVHNACHGDSGGPFMQKVPTYGHKHPGSRWFLSGIVSWGLGCAQKGYYGYYAHVSRLREFINNVTRVNFDDIKLTA